MPQLAACGRKLLTNLIAAHTDPRTRDQSMRSALARLPSAAGMEATSHASADELVREEDRAGFDWLVVDVVRNSERPNAPSRHIARA